ncbi:MAG: signal peptidase I [Gammaproteobacteria bacterium]|nr:signal peptidase I [Gammaproteobacteria bacterium]MDH3466779.1 signal peptidase I [Gammaproteobacteria bacterium]
MDFSLILFIALCVTGAIWLWDITFFAAKRRRSASLVGDEQIVTEPPGAGVVKEQPYREPLLVEYSKAFFPVILLVFLLRSFVVEPFRIPSGSMLPSLQIDDYILVNKFSLGVRLPILHRKIIDIDTPSRGDVMVFRYPKKPALNYIKRVVGLPGDTVMYNDKILTINGKKIIQYPDGEYLLGQVGQRRTVTSRRLEQLDDVRHDILVDSTRPDLRTHEYRVPEGHYFVMGDNRDYSSDSRIWGFVPESHIVGKAFFIWFSWDTANGGGIAWQRIGNKIQ